ncbi:hypothetical protein, partial [Akkermansia sp.]|uniref:hypothetical protein n=1 Tax=Akkermansia sp. TaxID=1872421 RepID=UPI003AB35379
MTFLLVPKLRDPLNYRISNVGFFKESVNATGEIKSANIRIQNIEAFDALAKALNKTALEALMMMTLSPQSACG